MKYWIKCSICCFFINDAPPSNIPFNASPCKNPLFDFFTKSFYPVPTELIKFTGWPNNSIFIPTLLVIENEKEIKENCEIIIKK